MRKSLAVLAVLGAFSVAGAHDFFGLRVKMTTN
jgi:hypothetical protein